MSPRRILFVSGRLAEFSLRRVLEPLSLRLGIEYDVAILGISVAALMHVNWVLRKLPVLPGQFSQVMLPGWCQGDLQVLQTAWQTEVVRGPKDLHDLPQTFDAPPDQTLEYGQFDIEIIAEINHAPRLTTQELLRQAKSYAEQGADVIDLGCIPGETWKHAGEMTRQLVGEGYRVSIDSFNRDEVESAVAAGAELVLSCNPENARWAASVPAEWVVIPSSPAEWMHLDETLDCLQSAGRSYRIDPILEPIGFGFSQSLARYWEARRRWPEAAMLMGIGNLTELTEVDSSGINLLLAAICQEQRIHSVLTTEVINWCRSAVQEFDIARRLVRHAIQHQRLPKHVDSRLVLLRDPRLTEQGAQELQHLATGLRDPNYRIFVERGEIHLMNRAGYWHGRDPFELFAQLPLVDAAHAFYLGYELSKALTALTLGKQYTQDQALRWGFLTIPERSHHPDPTGDDETSA